VNARGSVDESIKPRAALAEINVRAAGTGRPAGSEMSLRPIFGLELVQSRWNAQACSTRNPP